MSAVTLSGISGTDQRSRAEPGPAAGAPIRADGAARWRRRAGIGLAGVGIAMVPWLGYLATGLPPHYPAGNWNAAWVGLDALEALGLFSTGMLVRRQDPRAALCAAATATLLFVDAWFDVLTSTPADRPPALVMAVAAELPIAALCAGLAVRLFPRR